LSDDKVKDRYNININTNLEIQLNEFDDKFIEDELKLIDKLEYDRTQKVLEDLESQLSNSENSDDVELRKTKNEEYFFEQIQVINNNKDN